MWTWCKACTTKEADCCHDRPEVLDFLDLKEDALLWRRFSGSIVIRYRMKERSLV